MNSRPWPDPVDPTAMEPVGVNPKNEATLRRALQQLNSLIESFNSALTQIAANLSAITTNAADIATIEGDYLTSAYTGSSNIVTVGTIGTGTWQGSVINKTYLATDIVSLGTVATGVWQGTAVDHERGGLEGDVSAWNGLIGVSGGSTVEVAVPLIHEYGGLEDDVSEYAGLVKITGGATSAVTITDAGEAILDDADAAAQLTTLGIGNVEDTAISTWVGTESVTTLGTIGTGVWQGTVIDKTYLATDIVSLGTIATGVWQGTVINKTYLATDITSLGTIATGVWEGTAIDPAYLGLTFANSLGEGSGAVDLDGDEDTPGNDKLYGTNGEGAKGWYDQPAGGPDLPLTHENGGLETDVSGYSGLVKITGGLTYAQTIGAAGAVILAAADYTSQRNALSLGANNTPSFQGVIFT